MRLERAVPVAEHVDVGLPGLEEMTDVAHRPLDGLYAAVFIDAIVVRVRNGQGANRPTYAGTEVSSGEKDVLGLWAGSGGEGARFWFSVLTELTNRGISDVFFLVCDGLRAAVVILAACSSRLFVHVVL